MNKHSVALILPYYGKFPNYFPLWLKSAGANENFTFMIFTDIEMSGYDVPSNVQVHSMTLEEIRLRAARHLGFEPVLDRPYKLCDYRPMYGLIFQDYLKGYDFCGHVDPDVIWGDMGKFITDYLLDKYGRIFERGFLTMYRNTYEVNHCPLHKLPGWNISYLDVYKTTFYVNFDEAPLIKHLFSNFTHGGGGGQDDRIVFADIFTHRKEFVRLGYDILLENIAALRWTQGKLYGLAIDGDPGTQREYLYAHLQKRPMKFSPGLEKQDNFLIIPNEFVEDHELTQEEIDSYLTPDPAFVQSQIEKYGKKGVKRTFLESVRLALSRDTRGKIISLKNLWNKLRGRKLPSIWC